MGLGLNQPSTEVCVCCWLLESSSLHQASSYWNAQDFKAATPRQNWNRKDDMDPRTQLLETVFF